MQKHDIWGLITLFLILSFGIGILLNARAASLVAGTVFTGIRGFGRTLETRR